MTNSLAIPAYYYDCATALLHEDEIVAAAPKDRFSRKKHDARFPGRPIAYCLKEGVLDYVVGHRVYGHNILSGSLG